MAGWNRGSRTDEGLSPCVTFHDDNSRRPHPALRFGKIACQGAGLVKRRPGQAQ